MDDSTLAEASLTRGPGQKHLIRLHRVRSATSQTEWIELVGFCNFGENPALIGVPELGFKLYLIELLCFGHDFHGSGGWNWVLWWIC